MDGRIVLSDVRKLRDDLNPDSLSGSETVLNPTILVQNGEKSFSCLNSMSESHLVYLIQKISEV
jgi:hypothetical protein